MGWAGGQVGNSICLLEATTPPAMLRRTVLLLRPTIIRGGGTRFVSTGSSHQKQRQTVRRVVLTGAVALITITGAVTGATLKMDGDAAKQKRQFRETSIDDRIAMLEDRRAALVTMKMPLEKKLREVRARIEAEKEEGRGA